MRQGVLYEYLICFTFTPSSIYDMVVTTIYMTRHGVQFCSLVLGALSAHLVDSSVATGQ